MPDTFSYSARTASGEKKTGVIQADSADRVAVILAEQDLLPTEIKKRRTNRRAGIFGFLKARLYEDLIIFSRNLSTLYQAGIPILRALTIIKIGPADGYFNRSLESIRTGVESGRSLSEAMSDYPNIFPKIYTSAIAAGEASGKLDLILDSLGTMLEKDLDLHRQIKSSIRYPIVVVTAISIAFVVLITFVIPRFVDFYAKMNAELPAPTRAMIWMNEFINEYWMIVIASAIAGIFIIRKVYTTPGGKLLFDRFFSRLPVFGDLIVKGNIARFAYMFQILTRSGMPLVKSLELLTEVLKNSALIIEIKEMTDSFREGRELAGLFRKLVFFPHMALHMIQVGLESGSLDNLLQEVANHYSKEVDYKSRQLTSLLEPILTITLGIFILIVALAIFLPMWNLIQIFHK